MGIRFYYDTKNVTSIYTENGEYEWNNHNNKWPSRPGKRCFAHKNCLQVTAYEY